MHHHYVCVGGEALDERDELRVAHEHRAEHRAHFAARDLKMLHDVRHLLEAVLLALEALAARPRDYLRAPHAAVNHIKQFGDSYDAIRISCRISN